MTPAETATILRQFNEWRRGDEDIPQFDPRDIGEAIDAAVEMIERLETTENDAAHQKALADSALRVAEGWERKCGELRVALRHEADCLEAAKAEIDALRAKIEAMERQEPVGEVVHNGESAGLYDILEQGTPLYALPGAQQCKNCNGMGSRFDPSGEKIPCDLCESHLEEIRSLVAEAVHDIISGGDFWLSISLAAKKIYAIPGAHPKPDCGEAGHDDGRCGNRQCLPGAQTQGEEK